MATAEDLKLLQGRLNELGQLVQDNAAASLLKVEEQVGLQLAQQNAIISRDPDEAWRATAKLTSPWRTLGGQRETQSYEMKHLALTDSNEYMNQRAAASKVVEKSVNDAFETTNKAYLAAGFSRQQAEDAGMQVADEVMQTNTAAMKLQFGEIEDSVVTGSAARSSGNMFTGNVAPRLKK